MLLAVAHSTWPDVVFWGIVGVTVMVVAWAWAWSSVHTTKSDPFWNKKNIGKDDD